jgi:hypothetical protein
MIVMGRSIPTTYAGRIFRRSFAAVLWRVGTAVPLFFFPHIAEPIRTGIDNYRAAVHHSRQMDEAARMLGKERLSQQRAGLAELSPGN